MIEDCPQPESSWKPIVIGAPFWSRKRQWNSPVQLDLFPLQLEIESFRADILRGNHDAAVPVPPDGDPVRA